MPRQLGASLQSERGSLSEQRESDLSLKFIAGDLTIHRLIEGETTFLPVHDLSAGLTPDLLAENRQWLRDSGAIDATDTLILCFQSYVVRTPHHMILIDSCIGNDKPRPQRPKWNQKTDDTYMRALKAAGFAVEDIDFVMCTHLHVDHVGWNTRLEGGRWVPTFPKPRYVFGRAEYDYWAEQHAKAEVLPFGDSVLPRSQAGGHRARRFCDRRSFAHSADAGTYARPCRLRGRPGQGRRGILRRHHAFAATDSLSRIVAKIRCRSGARGQDPARFHGALLRHRHALLHGAFSVALDRKNPAPGQRIFLRGGKLKARARGAEKTLT
jgi:Metallo-beta-lactamase superfamily